MRGDACLAIDVGRVTGMKFTLLTREVAPFLHVKLKTVRRWRQTGLLLPTARFNRSIYFDRTAVAAFQQRLFLS